MATWDADTIIITIYDSSTGELDSNSYTIELQPVDQAYDTGAIACSQLTSGRWKPDSDLDTELAYDVYNNTVKIGRIWGTNLMPAIGG